MCIWSKHIMWIYEILKHQLKCFKWRAGIYAFKQPWSIVVPPSTLHHLLDFSQTPLCGLKSCENYVKSFLRGIFTLQWISFPSPSRRFLEQFLFLGLHCFNNQTGNPCVSSDYLHFCQASYRSLLCLSTLVLRWNMSISKTYIIEGKEGPNARKDQGLRI